MNTPTLARTTDIAHRGPRAHARRVEDYLPRVEALVMDAARETCGEDAPLLDLLAYQMASGGKRLRALLPLQVAAALGVDPARVLSFAAACEVLHNASLVHDDIQDGDRSRRGRPTVWARSGVARAIGLGDAMLCLAVALAQDVDAPPAARLATSRRLSRTALALATGQDRELAQREDAARPVPSREDYVALAAGKTSSLFALPLAGAAELCGMPSADVAALDALSTDLGVLFQIQDDVLDLYGDKGRDQALSDLYEGKRSFLVVAACERLTPPGARRLLQLLDLPREAKTPAVIDEIMALLDEARALDAARGELTLLAARIRAAAPARLAALLDRVLDVLLAPIAQALADSAPAALAG